MEINDFIINLGKEKGFCHVGFTDAEAFENIREPLKVCEKALSGFVEVDTEKRIDPKLTFNTAKTIIVFIKSFNQKINVVMDKEIRAYISIGAVGEDYHVFMERELGEIGKIIEEKYGCKAMCFSDTGPLNDRSLAIRSGLGYVGKNFSVISENAGAMGFIGYIITDLDLEKENIEKENACGSCNLCVKSCPTGAISNGEFKMEKCISYLTQKKGVLSAEEMKLVGINIYGCDKCQTCCPKNKEKIGEVNNIDEVMPKVEELLLLSNRQFKDRFGKTAIAWRGNTIIKRNALIALANMGQVEMLKKYVDSENQVLRQTAMEGVKMWDTGIQED